MPKFTRKTTIAVVTAALVLGVGGTAYAYWTQSGAGTGTAAAGATTLPVAVLQSSTVSGLYPGSTPQALSGTLTNPNAAAVTVGKVTATVESASGSCNTGWFTITGNGTASNTILAGLSTTTTWSGITVSLTNDPLVNQDSCKGATLVFKYTIAAGV